MDENLTRPTCSAAEDGPSGIVLSVVIPAYNAADDLRRCLDRLKHHVSVSHEIIVVDDASTDRTAEIAETYGACCFRRQVRGGPASARNWGAFEARGQWILFLDADVLIHNDTVERAFSHIAKDPTIGALFGSYDDEPDHPGFISRFRNLLHHHVHQTGRFSDDARPASTFWTGCGLIRRRLFLDFGGFDHWRYEQPAIEDIELGYRLTAAGHKIVLARDVLCKHLKPWTLRTMVRTDFFQRGLPWSLLMLRSHRRPNDLNVDRRQKLAALASAGSWFGIAIMPFVPAMGSLLVACCLICVLSVNRSFLKLLRAKGGARLSTAGIALLHVYYAVCLTSYAAALALHSCRPANAGSRGDTLAETEMVPPPHLQRSEFAKASERKDSSSRN